MITLLAIGLAVIGACCFAFAATLQHRAVDQESTGRSFGLQTFRRLVRRPGWLAGLAFGFSGATLGLVAISLAPVSVIQPIGIISVPLAVLLAARRNKTTPSKGMVIGIGVSILAIAVFVALTAGSAVTSASGPSALLLTTVIVAAVVAVLAVLSRSQRAWLRCAASAAGGATAFGLMSVLVKNLSEILGGDLLAFTDPVALAVVAGIAVAFAAGGWLTQQAFASGPPELVLACLTVVDPLVAVVLGTLLLGEGAHFAPATVALMIICAIAAAGGIVILGRYHPDVIARSAPEAAPRTKPHPTPVPIATRRPKLPIAA